MKRTPKMYNTEHDDDVLKLSTRSDKMGNVLFFVEWTNEDKRDYACFRHMSSAMDFINSNFK